MWQSRVEIILLHISIRIVEKYHLLTRLHSVYEPPLNGSSEIQCFKFEHSDVIEIRDRIMFVFYLVVSQQHCHTNKVLLYTDQAGNAPVQLIQHYNDKYQQNNKKYQLVQRRELVSPE